MSKPTKYRVYDMANEFNQDVQVIIDFLNKRKIKVKNRFTGVEEDAYQLVKAQFGRRKPVEPAQKPQSQPQQQKQSKPAQKPQPQAQPQQQQKQSKPAQKPQPQSQPQQQQKQSKPAQKPQPQPQ
ncbi:MAG: hypothetical protein IJL14_07125, partial [Selenomonadaceae bacterium]|nr:hypothetical protein [Selenomonadaceae bacterium]